MHRVQKGLKQSKEQIGHENLYSLFDFLLPMAVD